MSGVNQDGNNIFVDTNVIIGAWAGKASDKKCLQYLYSLKGKRLFMSALSVAQFVSVFQDKKSNDEIVNEVKYYLTKFSLVGFQQKDVEASLSLKGGDLEDNIQYVMCQKVHCHYVITNNVKDFNKYQLIENIVPSKVRKIV